MLPIILFISLIALTKFSIFAINVDVKIGFLVGSKRLKHDQTYSRPGRHLIHAFNYSIHEINRDSFVSNQTSDHRKRITFTPIIAETYGNESESIKQTVDLIAKHGADFIVGPQESCQTESKLASVYNIGMISHFCTPIYKSQQLFEPNSSHQQISTPQTYIQTKPPYWKIVDRVTTLVSRLIHLQNRYPQQLVLLYFKEQSENVANKRPLLLTLTDSTYNRPQNSYSHSSLSNEAVQYKLIGELLEIKLNELLLPNKGKENDRGGIEEEGISPKDNNGYESRSKRKPLVVLNWHTTFHYGYTKNPFRQLIRRYLFQQQFHSTTALVNQSIQCAPSTAKFVTTTHHYHGVHRRRRHAITATTTTAATTTPISSDRSGNFKLIPRASIYIVVGHYYEHLGLMLALNELGLLGSYQTTSTSTQTQQQPLQHRPSVLANQQQSVVIGVDIEQYDERDDSVRFLRGLLMDESGNSRQQPSRPDEDLDSVAAMYRSYLGVVPAKPTKSAEFLDDIRKLYDQSSVSDREIAQQQQLPQHLQKFAVGSTALSNQTSTSADTIQITHRLLQLIRLPVEAFYLHDSVKLLGEFFNHCIIRKNLTLNECREGSRAFEWFKERKYSSFVNQNLTNFDFQAQTEGLYTLITRKLLSSNESNDAEDEFGLVPVGRFVTSNTGSNKLVFDVDSSSIDPIWFPLWCDVSGSDHSKCLNISNDTSSYNTLEEISSSSNTQAVVVVGLIFLVIILIVCLTTAHFAFGNQLPNLEKQTTNNKWFNLEDEKNFLNIVHNYLLSLDNSLIVCEDAASYATDQLSDDYEHFALVELHCYMFPFPSCKFVHWLTALHHVKEMMFQYQIELSSNCGSSGQSRKQPLVERIFELFRNRGDKNDCISKDRNFFTSKHKGTASLRLILNKYRSINECFCNLTKLDHATVAKLKGVTLSYGLRGGESKLARLIVEHPVRGNLRDCFKYLPNILDKNETNEFKTLILLPLIGDILNGLEYLHKSSLKFHGELRSTTCMITTNWTLKLSGFQVQHLRRSLGEYEQKNLTFKELEGLIYSAPEVLENCYKRSTLNNETLKLADIYSFAFVIYEMFVGEEPWTCLTQVSKSKLLIERVKVDSSFRPPLSRLDEKALLFKYYYTGEMKLDLELLKRVIRSCWSYSAELRPKSTEALRSMLEQAFSFSSPSIPNSSLRLKNLPTTTKTSKIIEESTCNTTLIAVSGINMASTQIAGTEAPETYTKTSSLSTIPIPSSFVPTIAAFNSDKLMTSFPKLHRSEDIDVDWILRYYTKILERSLIVNRKELVIEKKASSLLRMKLLPGSILSKLCNGEKIVPKKFDCISLCSFGFMITLDQFNQNEILFVDFLNKILCQLDKLVESYQNHIHLLDSQVDSSLRYIAYSGKPLYAINRENDENEDEGGIYNHAQLIASFALQLIDLVNNWQTSNSNKHYIQVTCGLHSGSVVAGIISNNNNNNNNNNSNDFNHHLMSNSLMRYVLLGSSMSFVNILQQTCQPQKIHISSQFKNLLISSPIKLPVELKDINTCQGYVVVQREGRIETKKFGDISSHWLVNGPRLNASQSLMMVS